MPNLRKLDLNFLTLFDALVIEGNLTTAAARVGLSQPAASAGLKRMRLLLGDQLFVRVPGGMAPTVFAAGIAPAVRHALETVQTRILQRPLDNPQEAARIFRLCVSDAGGLAFLPPIVRKLREAAPLWNIEVHSLNMTDLPRALAAGEFDLAIGNLYTLGPNIYRQRLAQLAFRVIHRRDHPAMKGGAPTMRSYLDAQHAVMRIPGSGPSLFARALAKKGYTRIEALSVPHYLLLPPIVAQTDLLATVPEHVAREFAGIYRLAVWPVPFAAPPFTMSQYWHRRYNSDPASKWVRRLIRDLFPNRSSGQLGAPGR